MAHTPDNPLSRLILPMSYGVSRGRVLFKDRHLLTIEGFEYFERRIGDQYSSTLKAILAAAEAYPHQSHHRLEPLVTAVKAELALRDRFGVTK